VVVVEVVTVLAVPEVPVVVVVAAVRAEVRYVHVRQVQLWHPSQH